MTPRPAAEITDEQVRGMDDMLDAAIAGLPLVPTCGADLRHLAVQINTTPPNGTKESA